MFAIDPKVCTGCGSCQEACPCDAISESEEGYFVVDYDACAECGACFDVCEFNSVIEADLEEIPALISAG